MLDAYYRKEKSQRQLAQSFSVSLSFIPELLKRWGEEDTIAPREHGGITPKLNDEQLVQVKRLVDRDNNAISVELWERLEP